MKRLTCLLSVLLSLGIGTVSARAHGGCWGGHGYWGWGHGCYGGGYAPLFSIGICGFGISIGGTYPACGYGYGYPAYAPYPAYPAYSATYASTAYAQPVHPAAPAAYSQPVYASRSVQTQTTTTRYVAATPAYARAQPTPTVSQVSARVAPARSNVQAGPAVAQLSSGAQEVLKLSRAQVGTSVIQSFVHNSHAAYNLTAANIVYLHSEGVSDEVIGSMLAQKQAGGVPVSHPRSASTSVAVN